MRFGWHGLHGNSRCVHLRRWIWRRSSKLLYDHWFGDWLLCVHGWLVQVYNCDRAMQSVLCFHVRELYGRRFVHGHHVQRHGRLRGVWQLLRVRCGLCWCGHVECDDGCAVGVQRLWIILLREQRGLGFMCSDHVQ